MNHFESLYPPESMRDEVGKTLTLLERGNFVQVVGMPGTGKSTLLRLLAYNSGMRQLHLDEGSDSYLFVYMNFSEARKRNLNDVTKLVFLSLHQSLEERGMGEEGDFVYKKFEDALRLDDALVYFQYLKQCIEYLASRSLKTVFLIDRLEVYFQYMDERFFSHLRILRNTAKYSFSVVFSLDRPLDMTLERSLLADVYDLVAGNTVFVGVHHPEGLSFRMRHLEEALGKTCDEEVKKNLIGLTGGHGKLTKLSHEALLSEECGQKDMEAFLLLRRQVRGALSEIWNYFTLEEQQVLLGHSQNEEAVSFLQSLGILGEGAISIPLFTKYLSEKQQETSTLLYDPERHAILRGGIEISEMFSRSEFRLLQYLLEHQDEVVSRDDIVEYVWRDLPSQEGVTPQAFDQLVYRVRKKIEPDPAHPTLLTTVKGRGYLMKIKS